MQTQKQSWIKQFFKHKWTRRFLVVFLFLILAGVAAYIVTPYYFRHRLKKDIGEKRYAAIQQFLDSPVNIPDSWRVDEPYSEELIKAQQDLVVVWAPIEFPLYDDLVDIEDGSLLQRFQQQDTLSKKEWDNLDRFVRTYFHLVPVFNKLIDSHDYDIKAMNIGEPQRPVPDFTILQRITRYFLLRTHLLANKGEWQDAFESCFVPIRACVRSPATSVLSHLQAFSFISESCESLGCLARDCSDSQMLRKSLEELNQLNYQVNLNISDSVELVDLVGSLAVMDKKGYPVTFNSNVTGRFLVSQYYDLLCYATQIYGDPAKAQQWIDLHDRLLPRLYLMVNGLQQSFEQARMTRGVPFPLSGGAKEYFFWSRAQIISEGLGYSDVALKIHCSNYMFTSTRDDVPIREKLAKAKFDLARLAIVKRIEQLEKGHLPANPVELCESYFEEPLMDPFSQSPYLWQAEANCFYSVGPDGKDDDLRVTCPIDLYYGTLNTAHLSEGDISLLPWEGSVTAEPKE